MLNIEDPRTLYQADSELLALWASYFNLKNSSITSEPKSPDQDIDQQVAKIERLLG